MWYFIPVALVWGWGVYLAGHAIHSGRTSQGTLAWVLALIFAAPIAIPLYFMFGDRRLEGYIRSRANGRRRIDRITKESLDSLKAVESCPSDPTLRSLSSLARFPWTANNRCGVFETADEMYEQLLGAIERAQHYVLVQFYIYRNDTIGKKLSSVLQAAAKRGVATYVMYDELGCSTLPNAYFDELKQAGCRVSGFRTVPKRRRLLRVNFRNHRKLVVIDGAAVFFGGMNIGDEYRGNDKPGEYWRDTHAVAIGPSAVTAQLTFAEDWNWAQAKVLDNVRWTYVMPASGSQSSVVYQSLVPLCAPVESMLMFPSGPIGLRESGVLLFLQLISRAMVRLWIATPYLVCEECIVQAITLAKARGVDVRLLVPQKPDGFVVGLAALSFIKEFEDIGVGVYQYARGFTHQKIVLSDDVASVGSANLDHRSMKLNFELTGIVADAKFADAIAAMLAHDMKLAVTAGKSSCTAESPWRHFASRLARMAAPVL